MTTAPAAFTTRSASENIRKRISICGCVQGVGFRPFVYRLAKERQLTGEIRNTPQGVTIDIEGAPPSVACFLDALQQDLPPVARIDRLHITDCLPKGGMEFVIQPSETGGGVTSIILPDLAVCDDCLREIQDPNNRRYQYPFTNCTHCGPRFSIVYDLPYDRCHTSMSEFRMCEACRGEYENPTDRRFHAQPNACPVCGPYMELWDAEGGLISSRHDAVIEAASRIQRGEIIAVKGLGGFHLFADARNEPAAQALRHRKHRSEKPLALMVPDLRWGERLCDINPVEHALLRSVAAPIVLLKKQPDSERILAKSVSGKNPYLGLLLPYTPLHYILMQRIGYPVVATSGNLSDEPICIDEQEARQRLHGIADGFLIHNRKIVRHVDDSVVRVFRGQPCLIRRARGYAPLPISLDHEPLHLLAVGGHLKNTVAVTAGGNVFLSQHIGDLESAESFRAFMEVQDTLLRTYRCQPSVVIRDDHPDYLSSQHAQSLGIPTRKVQHHHAHILACMAEHHLQGRLLGVAWDGTGYGLDGTLWGSEFLQVEGTRFTRLASLKPFPLPGGETAVYQPRLIALGLLYALYGEDAFAMNRIAAVQAFTEHELKNYRTILRKKTHCPFTCAIGRLFDAVAAILGIRQRVSYEGQAAVELEWLTQTEVHKRYPFHIHPQPRTGSDVSPRFIIDPTPTIEAIIRDAQNQKPPEWISTRFHNTLTEIIVQIATLQTEHRIALSGGCFQNHYLLNQTVTRLENEGMEVYWHRQIPCNDGGIALGQIAYGAHALGGKDQRSCV